METIVVQAEREQMDFKRLFSMMTRANPLQETFIFTCDGAGGAIFSVTCHPNVFQRLRQHFHMWKSVSSCVAPWIALKVLVCETHLFAYAQMLSTRGQLFNTASTFPRETYSPACSFTRSFLRSGNGSRPAAAVVQAGEKVTENRAGRPPSSSPIIFRQPSS